MSSIIKPQLWAPGFNASDDLARGCIGYWPMWEGSGSRVMDLVGGYHGTIESDSTWGVGTNGIAINNGGTSGDHVSNALALSGSSPHTWSIWAYTAAVQQQWLWTSGLQTTGGWGFGVFSASGDCRFYSGGTSARYTTAAGVAQAGVWQNFVIVYDGSEITQVYVDGKEITPASNTSTAITATTASLFGGLWGTFWNTWDGLLSIPTVWNRILTAEEISTQFRYPHSLIEPPSTRVYSFLSSGGGAPPSGAIMNQIQGSNLGADLYNGTLL